MCIEDYTTVEVMCRYCWKNLKNNEHSLEFCSISAYLSGIRVPQCFLLDDLVFPWKKNNNKKKDDRLEITLSLFCVLLWSTLWCLIWKDAMQICFISLSSNISRRADRQTAPSSFTRTAFVKLASQIISCLSPNINMEEVEVPLLLIDVKSLNREFKNQAKPLLWLYILRRFMACVIWFVLDILTSTDFIALCNKMSRILSKITRGDGVKLLVLKTFLPVRTCTFPAGGDKFSHCCRNPECLPKEADRLQVT